MGGLNGDFKNPKFRNFSMYHCISDYINIYQLFISMYIRISKLGEWAPPASESKLIKERSVKTSSPSSPQLPVTLLQGEYAEGWTKCQLYLSL